MTDRKLPEWVSSPEYQERRKRQLEKHLIDRGVPTKDIAIAMGGACEQTDALKAVQAALVAGKRIVVLAGPRGVGKTTAASWWIAQPRDPIVSSRPMQGLRFVTAPQLARWPRYDDARMRQLTLANALVVDDLGVEYSDKNGLFLSTLDEVINERYALSLPTLMTTNLPATGFTQRYGERIADRIREVG